MIRNDIRRVECPKCGAPPRQPCTGKRGPRTSHHLERRRAASLLPSVVAAKNDKGGKVYFITTNMAGAAVVKIGFTRGNPYRRKADLQTGNAFKLRLLGYIAGTQADERLLHDRFSVHRLSGEWFAFAPEIAAFIDAETCA